MDINNQSRLKVEVGILSLPELGANYWSIPKCANTSVKYACLDALGLKIDEDPDDVYLPVHSTQLGFYIDKKRALNSGLLNFTIIRHPVHRAVSMYQDMTDKRKHKKIDGSDKFKRDWSKLIDSPHSFRDFVELLCRFKDEDRDVHFRSYTPRVLVGKNKVGPSLVICLEDLPSRLGELNAKLKFPIEIPHLHSTKKTAHVSDREKEKLKQIWRRDFALWEACKV